jgi:hypothetical protein
MYPVEAAYETLPAACVKAVADSGAHIDSAPAAIAAPPPARNSRLKTFFVLPSAFSAYIITKEDKNG